MGEMEQLWGEMAQFKSQLRVVWKTIRVLAFKCDGANAERGIWNYGTSGEWCRNLLKWELPGTYKGDPNEGYLNNVDYVASTVFI